MLGGCVVLSGHRMCRTFAQRSHSAGVERTNRKATARMCGSSRTCSRKVCERIRERVFERKRVRECVWEDDV